MPGKQKAQRRERLNAFRARSSVPLLHVVAVLRKYQSEEERPPMGSNSIQREPVQKTIPLGSVVNDRGVPDDSRFAEKHYRIGELAELWGLGRETIRKMLIDEPGVVKVRLGRKKAHTTYSVPHSVARRIHKKLSN